MGAWGTALYSDDTTCDVRDEFKDHLEKGLSHSAAERATLESFEDVLSDHQVECLVYFALAETEWKYGCLSDAVKEQALSLLSKGGDIKYWESDNPAEAKARAKALTNLNVRLLSPQPPLKMVKLKSQRPPKKQLDCPIGSLFELPLPDGNIGILKFAGLRIVGASEEAVFRLLPWKGKTLPSLSLLEGISEEAVTICKHHEFALFMSDGRKNPITHLVETNLRLTNSLPIDHSRSVSVNVLSIPQQAQDALDNFP
ncbi:MAG TPA: hypothetical protein VK946_05625 [Methylotenera sp.]|nr:hypothetical protein [Methylotenera sp.]